MTANKDTDYEASGARYVRLRLDTMRLEVAQVDLRAPPPLGVVKDQQIAQAGDAPATALQFKLPFVAWNGEREPWLIKSDMFTIRREGDAPVASNSPGDSGIVIARVPPESGVRFEVEVQVGGVTESPDGNSVKGDYQLSVADDGVLLMRTTLSAGQYSQLWQGVRFIGIVTAALAGLAVL